MLSIPAEDCETLKRDSSSTYRDIQYPWLTTTPKSSALRSSSQRGSPPKYDDLISTDYDEFKTQQLFGGGHVEEPPLEYHRDITSYEDIAAMGSVGRITDTGEVFWKFSSDQWLNSPDDQKSGEEHGKHAKSMSDNQAESQYGRLHDTKVHCAEQLVRPSDADILQPDMGDRTEFELKRSTRNMRYNALLQHPSSETRRPHAASKSTSGDFASGTQTSDDEAPFTFKQLPSHGIPRLETSGIEVKSYDKSTSLASSLKATMSRVSELLLERPDCETDTIGQS
nr:hypothetical protein CFP56_21557 [Quercus suber]